LLGLLCRRRAGRSFGWPIFLRAAIVVSLSAATIVVYYHLHVRDRRAWLAAPYSISDSPRFRRQPRSLPSGTVCNGSPRTTMTGRGVTSSCDRDAGTKDAPSFVGLMLSKAPLRIIPPQKTLCPHMQFFRPNLHTGPMAPRYRPRSTRSNLLYIFARLRARTMPTAGGRPLTFE